jgi:hypothetical protein
MGKKLFSKSNTLQENEEKQNFKQPAALKHNPRPTTLKNRRLFL